jgi:DNA polymerase-3 subunit gamma/tau
MSDSFDLGEPPQPARAEAYRVLARKYRPQTFAALIGQDAMVQTLANAIKRDRIAHAFLLTGVRGVGKTSTARLIAKGLNCIGPDGNGGPTIEPCGVCEPCRAIAEGRHIDVVEMDAASHTGIDDIREIIEAVRYSAVSARYKIYIIDEVHMLSKAAFNGLLKTLEEPPPHVKFLFATTEVNKVPVTVLSRCQRFDLRRIPADMLAAHFAWVAGEEQVSAEPEALALIARAAEGSARDGLSILDQAIAHAAMEGEGRVTAEAVRGMLGLSDRGAIRALFAMLLEGDAPGALAALRQQYDLGVDPAAVLRILLETVHAVTLAKVQRDGDPSQSEEEREALANWSGNLSFATLHRLWQLLLKGHDEVQRSALPIEACEMALLRIVHAASLPDPADLARRLANGEGVPAAPQSAPVAPSGPANYAALVKWLETNAKQRWSHILSDDVRLIRFELGEVVVAPLRPLPADMLREFGPFMRDKTGVAWRLETSEGSGEPTLREQEMAIAAADREAVLSSPNVRAIIEAFPEAELVGWTDNRSAA